MTDFVKRNEIDTKADELRDAAEMCNDEMGEWWESLVNLVPKYRDGASVGFATAIELEIVSEYQRLKEEFTIIDGRLVHESEL